MMYCHMYISQCQSFASHSEVIRALYECLVIVLLSTYSLNKDFYIKVHFRSMGVEKVMTSPLGEFCHLLQRWWLSSFVNKNQ